MNLSVWLTVITLPATIFLTVSGVPRGSVQLDTVADYLLLAIAFPVAFVISRFIMFGETRRLNRVRTNIKDHIEEHESLGHVIIQVTGEDAQTQWPKIKCQLDAWAQRVNEWERGEVNEDSDADA